MYIWLYADLNGIKVKKILIDFEAVVWSTNLDLEDLRTVPIRGCSFHLRQTIWQKIQVRPQNAYSNGIGI